MIFKDKLNEYYGDELEALKESKDDEDETNGEELSVEDSIKKELEELKSENKDSQQKDILLELPIGAESLTFFKTRKPIVPSEFVMKICESYYESKEKTSRFVQKMYPIDQSCTATIPEFKKMAQNVLEGKFESGQTYNIGLVKRNFTVIERDTFTEMLAELLPGCGLRYKGADKIIIIYCFKSNIGMSVIDNNLYERLCRFNLQQIYDKVNGLIKEKEGPKKDTEKGDDASNTATKAANETETKESSSSEKAEAGKPVKAEDAESVNGEHPSGDAEIKVEEQ
ncbi:unnamed protein product [Ambrosiozyma monospora]|uniref:Unnamed protein product n=1 Tax=Ambrosiozyma monospora TaxID=43982 RepID=A0ACB5T8Q2_AMBMO|nr:unnamed protein product [Ambrosiozyma monospora]